MDAVDLMVAVGQGTIVAPMNLLSSPLSHSLGEIFADLLPPISDVKPSSSDKGMEELHQMRADVTAAGGRVCVACKIRATNIIVLLPCR